MPKETVRSAAIESVNDDEQKQELDIELTTGRVYRYFGVPPDVYGALRMRNQRGASTTTTSAMCISASASADHSGL
jgi:hypothetical protein